MCEHDPTACRPTELSPLAGRPIARRRMLVITAGLAAALPWRRGHASPPPPGPTVIEPVEVIPGLRIVPRAAWGADLPPTDEIHSEDVRFLLVHHSGTPNTTSDARQFIRSVYSFHTGPEKGWPDVCYQFFIDPQGTIWEGRAGALDGPVIADATGGSQGFAQLVCLIGDFNGGLPTARALGSLRLLLAWLADRSGLDTSPGASATFVSRGSQRWKAGVSVTTPTINGHRSMSFTDCPGDALWAYTIEQLQADVHAVRSELTRFEPPPDDRGLSPARRGVRRTLRS